VLSVVILAEAGIQRFFLVPGFRREDMLYVTLQEPISGTVKK